MEAKLTVKIWVCYSLEYVCGSSDFRSSLKDRIVMAKKGPRE